MKFESIVTKVLTEMPHISFNTDQRMVDFNFEAESFRGDYPGFLKHVRDFYTKLEPNAKKEFLKEIGANQQLPMFLKKVFPELYAHLVPEAIIKKFYTEFGTLGVY